MADLALAFVMIGPTRGYGAQETIMIIGAMRREGEVNEQCLVTMMTVTVMLSNTSYSGMDQ